MLKIELYHRLGLLGRRHYFRVKGRNGEIMIQSEGYVRKADMLDSINVLRLGLKDAVFIDLEFETKK